MKEIRFRLIIIVLSVVFSGYLLYPTYQDYVNGGKIEKLLNEKKAAIVKANPGVSEDNLAKVLASYEDSVKLNDPAIRAARLKRIKLGLDLQGGMRLVLEVNTTKLIEKIAQNQDDTFREVLKSAADEAALNDEPVVGIFVRKMQERGIRLSRYFGSIRDEESKIIADLTKQTEDAVSRAQEIIRNRIDQYGVSEPSIQKQGDRRIVVELPGVAKEEEARQLLQGTALLEFKLLKDPEFTIGVMEKIDKIVAGKPLQDSTAADSNAIAKDSSAKSDDSTVAADTNKKDTKQMSKEEFAKEHPFFAVALLDPQGRHADAYVQADDRDKITRMLSRPDVQRVIPNNVEFLFSAKPVTFQEGKGIYMLYMVTKEPELTGGVITNAQATLDPNSSTPMVTMQMNAEGSTEWARITGANIGKRCAIVLDGLIYSAPVIRNKIPSGNSQIEGSKDLEEAKLLEIVLKAGALPAPVEIIEERTVGPSLGQDSITRGFNSALFGYLAVALFMILYYQRAGGIAAVGLTITVLLILGVLAGFGATLTLPGIAGIILTMGMAVDANVLIYERIREEAATGKTLRASVDGGFGKAFSAIFDSNVTTLITCIILYQFGTGPVQGFALTLMIGVLTSMFAALVVAKVIFEYMVSKGTKITLG